MKKESMKTPEIIDKALVKLVMDFELYASLIARIGVNVVDRPGGALAWTDGKGIYINDPEVQRLNESPQIDKDGNEIDCHVGTNEMMFILCHELFHLVGQTFQRGRDIGVWGDQSPEGRAKWDLWNAATDYEINGLLKENEVVDSNGYKRSQPVGTFLPLGLYDRKYSGMTAEEIYVDLQKDPNKQLQNSPLSINVMGNDAKSGGKDGDKGNEDGMSGMSKNGLKPLDGHVPISDGSNNEVLDRIRQVFDDFGSKSNGLGSTAMERMFGVAFKEQPFNWKKALSKYMKQFVKENYSWNKRSRAGIASGLILPGQGVSPSMHIAVALDTSGSISNREITAMMNHLYTILKQFKHFEIDVWCCGSKVYEETLKTFTQKNKREIKNYKLQSDGGNDMRENFPFLEKHYKHKPKPEVLIIMSDFYDPLDGDNKTKSICPVVGLVIDHKDFQKPTKMKFEAYPFTVHDK